MERYQSESSDSSDSDHNNKIVDYAYLLLEPNVIDHNLDVLIDDPKKTFLQIENLILHHNRLTVFPQNIAKFSNLKVLDVSNNGLTILDDIFEFCPLTTLIAKNNNLTNHSLPKTFSMHTTLRELNLSGNCFSQFPDQVLDFCNLKYLYLGGNQIQCIPRSISKLNNLQILSMGGNQLTEVPSTLAQLKTLRSLVLCDNYIESLPANIANLHQLKSLALHKNRLKTLPPEIVTLKNLTELSLRDNPLVVRFVSDMTHDPAALMELAARTIKLHNIVVNHGDVPDTVLEYLHSAHHCVNRFCKGVFFDNRVEHIKFVDFCGKYRIPLLQYLCSAKCATADIIDQDNHSKPARAYMLRKVLLG